MADNESENIVPEERHVVDNNGGSNAALEVVVDEASNGHDVSTSQHEEHDASASQSNFLSTVQTHGSSDEGNEELEHDREHDEAIVRDIDDDDDTDDDDDDADNDDDWEDEILGVFNNPSEVSDDEAIEIENEDASDADVHNYDKSLPPTHSYMGGDMDELHGRTIREEGEIMMMPLFFLPGVILVPGQILPLNLFHPQPISLMQKVISADKTFGLIFGKYRSFGIDEGDGFFSDVGVTVEIFSVKYDELRQGSMSVKGEGRQRFQILSRSIQLDGVMMGKIRILPNDNLPSCPNEALIYTHYLNTSSVKSQRVTNKKLLQCQWRNETYRYMAGFHKPTVKILNTSLTPQPHWIYRMYNPYFLMDQLLREIRSWNNDIDLETIPIDPEGFSHWITSSLPMTNAMKIELLKINSANLRLRRQIEITNECSRALACDGCGSVIANKNDLFSLSKRGPSDAYVNPGGHVHETLTFYKAQNISLSGHSTTEYSWFPGYAWTIACCKTCHSHLGWKFKAAKKGLQPPKFWGLTRTSLKPIFKEVERLSAKNVNTSNSHDGLRVSDVQSESLI